MSSGRIFGIKKSFILKSSALLSLWSFIAFIFVSIFYLKSPQLWFYGFCIFLGGFELLKSFLFRFDSSLYLGSLLFYIGISGIVFTYTQTMQYAAFYVAMSFIAASVTSFLFTKQRFHLIIAFSIIFVTIYSLLYVKNLITSSILIAFLVPFLISLLLEIIFLCFQKK